NRTAQIICMAVLWGFPRINPTLQGQTGLIAGRSGPECTSPREFLAGLQKNSPLPMEPGLHFLDSIEIYQLGPVDAHELIRIEWLGKLFQGSADSVGLSACMELYVVAGGTGPIQLLYRQENLAFVFLDKDAFQESLRRT